MPKINIDTHTINKQEEGVYWFANRFLKKHGLPYVIGIYQRKLLRWIIRTTLKEKDNEISEEIKIDPMEYNSLFLENEEIKIPKEKIDVIKVLGEDVLINDDDVREFETYSRQERASCFNFAEGGTRYDFIIKDDGNVYYEKDAEFDLENEDNYKQMFSQVKINQAAVNINITNYITFTNEHPLGIKKQFDENDKIIKIAANNNRIIAYAKIGGENKFLWAQMEDEFPEEHGNVRLKGVYVRKNLNPEKMYDDKKCWEKAWENFRIKIKENKEHPIWALFNINPEIPWFILIFFSIIPIFIKIYTPELLKKIIDLYDYSYKNTEFVKNIIKDYFPVIVEKKLFYEISPSDPTFSDSIIKLFDNLIDLCKKRIDDPPLPPIIGIADLNEIINQDIKEYNKVLNILDTIKYFVNETIDNDNGEKYDIKEIFDIGVSNPHRFEHYKKNMGGEIQAFLYSKEIESQHNEISEQALEFSENYKNLHNLIKQNLINMNVFDGNGFNDGTCNFFIYCKFTNGEFGILWLDEQEYFSEKWRKIHPCDRKYTSLAKMFSIYPVYEWFHCIFNNFKDTKWKSIIDSIAIKSFDEVVKNFIIEYDSERKKIIEEKILENFENSFFTPYDIIDEFTRLAVSRYAIVLAAFDKIYSISYMFGVSDKKWNEREYPSVSNDNCIMFLSQTINIRDDMTILMKGFREEIKDSNEKLKPGYWYQYYLPYNNQVGKYNHKWKFVTEEVFNIIDKFYLFGIYDIDIENNRNYYKYKGIDERAQYYEIEFLNKRKEIYDNSPNENWKLNSHRNPVYKIFAEKNLIEPLSFRIKHDHVEDKYFALYNHPRDDDLLIDLSSTDTYYLKTTDPLNNPNVYTTSDIIVVQFKKRIWDFSPPQVKKVTLQLSKEDGIDIKFDSEDQSLRFFTIGAVNLDEKKTFLITIKKININPDKKTFTIPEILEYGGISTKCLDANYKEYIVKDADIIHGLSVWFEDIAGHKATPDEIEIIE